MPYHEAILERVLRLTDRFVETREDVHEVRIEVKDLRTEVRDLRAELKSRSENSTIFMITTFAKEVMPPGWWALIIFLLLGSLMGLVSPETIISKFMGQSSQEQHPEHS